MKSINKSLGRHIPPSMTRGVIVFLCLTGLSILISGCPGPDDNGGTNNSNNGQSPVLLPLERVSVSSTGEEADNYSYRASLNSDGNLIAFYSLASNLVADDINGTNDVFVFNRKTKEVTPVSIGVDGIGGVTANGNSMQPMISANGRYVVFKSSAKDLIVQRSDSSINIFVHDLKSRTNIIASVNAEEAAGNAASDNPVINADGRYIAFQSLANNLVDGDTNGVSDVFVYDQQTGGIERVSVAPGSGPEGADIQADKGSFNPSLSADGRFVAFHSLATNLTSDDKDEISDVFVFDRQNRTIECVSKNANNKGNANSLMASISGDGRFVAFQSLASNLVGGDNNLASDIFIFDRQNNTIEMASVNERGAKTQPFEDSTMPYISADGRYIAFQSFGSKLVSGDSNENLDIFVRDRQTGTVKRVNVNAVGAQTPKEEPPLLNEGTDAAISADGNYIAFQSDAENLVDINEDGVFNDDTNKVFDIFVAPIK